MPKFNANNGFLELLLNERLYGRLGMNINMCFKKYFKNYKHKFRINYEECEILIKLKGNGNCYEIIINESNVSIMQVKINNYGFKVKDLIIKFDIDSIPFEKGNSEKNLQTFFEYLKYFIK